MSIQSTRIHVVLQLHSPRSIRTLNSENLNESTITLYVGASTSPLSERTIVSGTNGKSKVH
jgi:hypothetical protein